MRIDSYYDNYDTTMTKTMTLKSIYLTILHIQKLFCHSCHSNNIRVRKKENEIKKSTNKKFTIHMCVPRIYYDTMTNLSPDSPGLHFECHSFCHSCHSDSMNTSHYTNKSKDRLSTMTLINTPCTYSGKFCHSWEVDELKRGDFYGY